MDTETGNALKGANKSQRVCFILSPIAKAGAEIHKRFIEVLDYIIKPTFS